MVCSHRRWGRRAPVGPAELRLRGTLTFGDLHITGRARGPDLWARRRKTANAHLTHPGQRGREELRSNRMDAGFSEVSRRSAEATPPTAAAAVPSARAPRRVTSRSLAPRRASGGPGRSVPVPGGPPRAVPIRIRREGLRRRAAGSGRLPVHAAAARAQSTRNCPATPHLNPGAAPPNAEPRFGAAWCGVRTGRGWRLGSCMSGMSVGTSFRVDQVKAMQL